ncbi:hypothetical protein KAU33_16655 [Candidatus Dependentiae bacterium]|nr:hypothetical protein [Candidatus Dependentiae bacterium]
MSKVYFEHVSSFYFYEKLFCELDDQTRELTIYINESNKDYPVIRDEMKSFKDVNVEFLESKDFLKIFQSLNFQDGKFDFQKDLISNEIFFIGFQKFQSGLKLYINKKDYTVDNKNPIRFEREMLEDSHEFRIYKFSVTVNDEIEFTIKYRVNFIEGWVLQAYIEIEQKLEEDDIIEKLLRK